MAGQRDYKAEYQARKARAQEQGYTGYGQKRYREDAELTRIMRNPIFEGLPDDLQTKQNARLFQKGFMYVGKATPAQKKARDELFRKSGGTLDFGAWSQYYKDIVYPNQTGKQHPDPAFIPLTQDVDWDTMTPELFDRLMGA
jgi:hypothetical protein